MQRKLLGIVLVIGIALIVTPLAIGLPGKAAAGQRMIDNFRPIMEPMQVDRTAYFYDQVFVPLGKVTYAINARTMAQLATSMQGATLPPQAQAQLAGLTKLMQANLGVFSQVPAGLAHYQPLVATMKTNVDNYAQIDSLPDFRLFTWFFVGPGILLVLVSGYGILAGTRFAIPVHVHRPALHH